MAAETLEDHLRRATRNFTARLPEDQALALGRDLALALAAAHAEDPPRHPPLDPAAIERAKTRLLAETVYQTDSQSSLARIYGSALAIGETIEQVQRWPEEVEAVTREQLASIAERYLVARRSVTGYLEKA